MKLVVLVSSIFMVETELIASSRTFVSFYPIKFPKTEILEEIRDCVTDVQQDVPCSPLLNEWGGVVPFDVHTFHPSGKSSTVGIYSQRCSAATETLQSKGCTLKLKSISQYWLTLLIIGRQL